MKTTPGAARRTLLLWAVSFWTNGIILAIAAAGWTVEIVNTCTAEARPTPAAKVLEGAQIDVFPVAPTTLEWCVLVAR